MVLAQMTRARVLLMQYLLRRMRRRSPKIYRLYSLLWNLRCFNHPDDAAAGCELERRLRECKAKNLKRAARRQRGREKKIEASQEAEANKAAPEAGLPTLSSLPSVGAAAVPPMEVPLVPTPSKQLVAGAKHAVPPLSVQGTLNANPALSPSPRSATSTATSPLLWEIGAKHVATPEVVALLLQECGP